MERKNKKDKRKQVIVDLLKDPLYVPMKRKEMGMLLGVTKAAKEEFTILLNELEEEGQLHVDSKGRYHQGPGNVLVGIFQGTQHSFGFIVPKEGEEDIFVPADEVNGAFHNDKVSYVLTRNKEGGKRAEAKVVSVLERGITTVVGTFQKNSSYGFVVPDFGKFSQDIFVPLRMAQGAVSGHKVVVELTYYGDNSRHPEGKIVEILGHKNDPGVDVLSIVKTYQLPTGFSDKLLRQAERVSKPVSEADRQGREDFRSLCMVTIDGEDAKDLDDAVSLVKDETGWTLGVHIADVTNYVQENSALDHEAKQRGTSVYLADRVIPMLPHALSNGICSLNANEDRLALSCLMHITFDGQIDDHQICESVVNVDCRLSYNEVHELLTDQNTLLKEKYSPYMEMLTQMEKVSSLLRKKRQARGSIDFDFPEAKLILDDKGEPIEIRPYERNEATFLIEEFMLAANETVAEDFFWREIPFLYRTHGKPEEDKMKSFATFIQNFGWTLAVSKKGVHPKELQKLLVQIEGSKEEDLICRLALRSMQRAVYSTENTGHFGLAASHYCHFTSPIRRYPDLQIHRIIKETLRGKMSPIRIEHYETILPEVASCSSVAERRADEAERETIKLKKAQYMEHHIGERYQGVISGMTKWGMYVELHNTVEGLVHVENMPGDHYTYLEDRYEMVGERTGKTYHLGQRVMVEVYGADKLSRTIDFKLAKEETNGKREQF